jgi:hypothetical protein
MRIAALWIERDHTFNGFPLVLVGTWAAVVVFALGYDFGRRHDPDWDFGQAIAASIPGGPAVALAVAFGVGALESVLT